MEAITVFDFDAEYAKQLARMSLFDEVRDQRRELEENRTAVVEQQSHIQQLKEDLAKMREHCQHDEEELTAAKEKFRNDCPSWILDNDNSIFESIASYMQTRLEDHEPGTLSADIEGADLRAEVYDKDCAVWTENGRKSLDAVQQLTEMVEQKHRIDILNGLLAGKIVSRIRKEQAVKNAETLVSGLQASSEICQQAIVVAEAEWNKKWAAIFKAVDDKIKAAVAEESQ
ncbi:uncharacterized protein LY89DRAFT_737957 [Mollisia scopiformis]|uniref:Uncharacterized protein n=1 Tax=Mollisia scopiformis TaxID=149040 RepID=A0A194WZM3_MOLSC|nr:uncharacterized protein LY89DRAFT_737957 [Mollisia scopiformis]KUJ13062.1 hypothetical protein LY89DRAFT_737957 [Mollisia scopiformis]